MVKQVKGWQASDGSLHDSYQKAVTHDALIQLKKLDIFNEATRKACIEYAQEICDALSPVLCPEPAEVHDSRAQ